VSSGLELVERHGLIDEVLEAFAVSLGPAGGAYRGHVYRVFNLSLRLLGSERRSDELAVSSVFHDLGIWADRTFDYLEPSIARANDYLAAREHDFSAAVITAVIENHHLLRRVRGGADAALVEAFRRADLVDVSRAWYGAGLERAYLRELVSTFPYSGFHGVLLRAGWGWFVRHPLRPLPMLRFRSPSFGRALSP
jgi:hypothetical protein